MSTLPDTRSDFNEILGIIASAKQRAVQAVNTTLIELYWQVGEVISRKIAGAEWGDGVVDQLAVHIARTQPGLRGFTRPHAPVLRGLPRRRKNLTTGETIAVDA